VHAEKAALREQVETMQLQHLESHSLPNEDDDEEEQEEEEENEKEGYTLKGVQMSTTPRGHQGEVPEDGMPLMALDQAQAGTPTRPTSPRRCAHLVVTCTVRCSSKCTYHDWYRRLLLYTVP
jgi:hypothetical protein